MSEYRSLGKLLLKLRKSEATCTQEALAKQLEVSSQAISHWENDRRPPKDVRLEQYSKLYDISMDVLIRCRNSTDYSTGGRYRYEPINDFLDRVDWDILQFQSYVFHQNNHFNNGLVIEEDIHGTPEQWAEITTEFTELLVVISDTKKATDIEASICGYWQVVPMLPRYFDLLVNGYILDSEISLDMLDDFVRPTTPYDMYGVAVMSKGGGSSGLGAIEIKSTLYRSYHETLEKLATNTHPIYVGRICAVPETPGGKRACTPIGLKDTNVSQKTTNYTVFQGDYLNVDTVIPIFEDNRVLAEQYSQLSLTANSKV